MFRSASFCYPLCPLFLPVDVRTRYDPEHILVLNTYLNPAVVRKVETEMVESREGF